MGPESDFNAVTYVPKVADVIPQVGEAGKTTVYVRKFAPGKDNPRNKDLQRLVPAGARVALSGNADSFAYAQTQIVFYDRSRQEVAVQVRQALGTGKLVLSRQPLDVVDVTVVIGKDFNG